MAMLPVDYRPFTRRQALQTFATATVLAGVRARGASESTLQIGGKPVEVALSSVSPSTGRIEVLPLDGNATSVTPDGALVQEQWGKRIARLRGGTKGKGMKCGDLTVTVTDKPLTIRVQDKAGRTV